MSSSNQVFLTTASGETYYESGKSWEQLRIPEHIIHNAQLLNWVHPTLIQSAAIPVIIQGHNLVAQSKNGTGKTGAFVIGALATLEPNQNQLQALCISHTRELNQQNFNILTQMAGNSGLRIGILQKGDKNFENFHVLCVTHGTARNLANRRNQNKVANVKLIVYDEADFLLSHPEHVEILSQVKQAIPTAQQLLFSATFPENVQQFIDQNIPNAYTIRIQDVQDLTLDNVDQCVVQCQHNKKFDVVSQIIQMVQVKCCIIFANTKKYIGQLQAHLTREGHKVFSITGELDVQQRDQIIENVRKGQIKILIATDLLSRGVDFRLANLVINLDPPVIRQNDNSVADPTTYLHRVGRTGRYGRRGIALNIVSDELSQRAYIDIGQYYGQRFEGIQIEQLDQMLDKIKNDYEVEDEEKEQ